MDSSTTIQFSHANGIPAGTYTRLFQALQPHRVEAVHAYGIGDFPLDNNWRNLVPELIHHIESHQQAPVIGLGHSLGGVLTYWAALARPDLFRAIIVMDPPFISWQMGAFLRLGRAIGLLDRTFPLLKLALVRKHRFADRAEARAYWGGKKFFQQFHPDSFEGYVQTALVDHPREDGLVLTIPREVEAAVFREMPYTHNWQAPKVPFYYLYPGNNEIDRFAMAQNRRRFPKTTFYDVEGSHMFPLEYPDETGALLRQIIAKVMEAA